MAPIKLDTAYTDRGLPWTHFFNGRVLSREDMDRDRDAARTIDRRLGRALGDGVVCGLEVAAREIGGGSITDPVVTVQAGVGINRGGETVALEAAVDVLLRRPTVAEAAAASSQVVQVAGAFNDCAPPDPSVYVAGSGVYLLTVAPASSRRGLAMVSGLGNQAAPCNAKEEVVGVMFRLLQVGVAPEKLNDTDHLRSRVAYDFFLAEGAAADDLARNPFGPPANVKSAIAALTEPAITDCEIPLAVLHWTATGGLRFVDPWIARRRVTPPVEAGLGVPQDARRRALGEAMVRQFQTQLDTVPAGLRANFKASSVMRHLPPFGMLPMQATGELQNQYFTIGKFFDGVALRKPAANGDQALVIDGARLRFLMAAAALFPPIEIARHEFIWTYFVRENHAAARQGEAVRPFVVFASGHVPYLGEARADLGRWDDANYALP